MGRSTGYRKSKCNLGTFRQVVTFSSAQLLHIHPLTLEDILQQDPREKVEDFPKLGYYFISFRAVESPAARERVQHEAGFPDSSSFDEGFIREANVYLTVFNGGICCVRIHLV